MDARVSIAQLPQATAIVTYEEVSKEFAEQFDGYKKAVRDVAGDRAEIETRRISLTGKDAALPDDDTLDGLSRQDDATMLGFLDALDKARALFTKLGGAQEILTPVDSSTPAIVAYKRSIASRDPKLLETLEADELRAVKIFGKVRAFIAQLRPVKENMEASARFLRGSIHHFRQDVDNIKHPPVIVVPPPAKEDVAVVKSYFSSLSSMLPSYQTPAPAPVVNAPVASQWDAAKWESTLLACEELRLKSAQASQDLLEEPLAVVVEAVPSKGDADQSSSSADTTAAGAVNKPLADVVEEDDPGATSDSDTLLVSRTDATSGDATAHLGAEDDDATTPPAPNTSPSVASKSMSFAGAVKSGKDAEPDSKEKPKGRTGTDVSSTRRSTTNPSFSHAPNRRGQRHQKQTTGSGVVTKEDE